MKRPNILYIMSDDHTANAISCYQSILAPVFKTPNMDSISQNGKRLERFYATNSICTPARATVMTGQYGHVSGVKTLADTWHPECTPNLAQLLKDSGYQTAMFGKWHLDTHTVGFDQSEYLCDVFGQGVYWNPSFLNQDKERITHEGYVTDVITDLTSNWLKNRDKDKPFFVMCHHKAPHDFWEYPERKEHLFDGIEIPAPDSLFEDRSHRSEASRDFGSSVSPRSKVRSLYEDFQAPDYVTGPLVITEDMTFEEKAMAAYQKYLKDYLRTVSGIDDSVGALIKQLEEEGVIDDTIIIYTSDQGMFLGEHDYQDKRWSFEESLRAPFLIQYPREIKPGTVSYDLMANLDIAPLLLDYAGVEIPKEMQGESFRDMIADKEDANKRDSIYFRYWMHRAHSHDNPAHYGIRTDKYKLIFYYGLPLDANGAEHDCDTPTGWELYDMENDRLEMHNLYENPEYKEVVAELRDLLQKQKEKYGDLDCDYPELVERYNDSL